MIDEKEVKEALGDDFEKEMELPENFFGLRKIETKKVETPASDEPWQDMGKSWLKCPAGHVDRYRNVPVVCKYCGAKK